MRPSPPSKTYKLEPCALSTVTFPSQTGGPVLLTAYEFDYFRFFMPAESHTAYPLVTDCLLWAPRHHSPCHSVCQNCHLGNAEQIHFRQVQHSAGPLSVHRHLSCVHLANNAIINTKCVSTCAQVCKLSHLSWGWWPCNWDTAPCPGWGKGNLQRWDARGHTPGRWRFWGCEAMSLTILSTSVPWFSSIHPSVMSAHQ